MFTLQSIKVTHNKVTTCRTPANGEFGYGYPKPKEWGRGSEIKGF